MCTPPFATPARRAVRRTNSRTILWVNGAPSCGRSATATDAAVAPAIAGALRAAGYDTVFQRIDWSGANTVAARRAAIAELEARLPIGELVSSTTEGIAAANPRRREASARNEVKNALGCLHRQQKAP